MMQQQIAAEATAATPGSLVAALLAGSKFARMERASEAMRASGAAMRQVQRRPAAWVRQRWQQWSGESRLSSALREARRSATWLACVRACVREVCVRACVRACVCAGACVAHDLCRVIAL